MSLIISLTNYHVGSECIRDESARPCDGTGDIASCIGTPQKYFHEYVSTPSGVNDLRLFITKGGSEEIKVTIDSFDATIKNPDVEIMTKNDIELVHDNDGNYQIWLKKSTHGPQLIIIGLDVKLFNNDVLKYVYKQVIFLEVSENEF